MTNDNKKVQKQDAQKAYNEHKEQYLKDHSLESMVYENGAGVAMIFRELVKLNQNLQQLKNQIHESKNS